MNTLVTDVTTGGHFFVRGCALPHDRCTCGRKLDPTCRNVADNPLLLEFERQQERSFPHHRCATIRLHSALHEAAHAVVALRYVPFRGRIVIPWNAPLRAHARDATLDPDHTAEVYFAGAAVEKLLLGSARYARHDALGGLTMLTDEHGDTSATDAHARRLLRHVLGYLSSPAVWPKLEALATEAMKHEDLWCGAFRKAARKAGLAGVGGAKRRAAVETYLQRFSRSPAELLNKLGPTVVGEWAAAMEQNARRPVP